MYPTVENVNAVLRVLVETPEDLYLSLTCLKILRTMFTNANKEEYTILDVLKQTKIIAMLNDMQEIGDGRYDGKFSPEILWLLQNMTYCCGTNEDIHKLVNQIIDVNQSKPLH